MSNTPTLPAASEKLAIERRLLSALLLDVAHLDMAISEGLTAEAFQYPISRTLFLAMLASASQERDLALDHIYQYLPDDRRTPQILQDLVELTTVEATGLRARPLVGEVMGAWRKRRLKMTAAKLAEVSSDNADWEDTWGRAGPLLDEALDIGTDVSVRSIAQIVESTKKQLCARGQSSEVGISSGFGGFDRKATRLGIELVILAARPSVGKSSFAAQLVGHALHAGRGVGVFSLENTSEQFVERMAAQESGVPVADAMTSNSRARSYLDTLDAIGRREHLYLFDDVVLLEQIVSKCRMLAATGRLGLVVIDYLQLIDPGKEARREPREQQVSTMSRRLKMLAGQLHCPVLLLAQLNRAAEKENRRPRLSDLRESGSIEQDADRVWFLHRLDPPPGTIDYADDPGLDNVELWQAKCRSGPAGFASHLAFRRPTMFFLATTNLEAPLA